MTKKINTIEKLTQNVLDAYAHIENPRTKKLIQSLIKHLHSFVIDTNLSESEWEFTWGFLADMAKFTNPERNEFLLLADVFGVSQLIEMINHQRPMDAAGFALVGPFYRANAPFRERGACIASEDTPGERVKISGQVINLKDNKPLQNATLDVWQAATNGLYETQDPNQPDMNLRGKFKTDAQGTFELTALMPTPYPVPTDGPVGQVLKLAKRHPLRPAHIHFIVSAPGYETLITQVFVAGDDIVNSDVVFTANKNMIGHFNKEHNRFHLHYDFQLKMGKSIQPKAPIQ